MNQKHSYVILLALGCLLNIVFGTSCDEGQLLMADSDQCVDACPSTYYVPDGQAICEPQTQITARLQPTPEESVFLLVFAGPFAPFQTNDQLINNMTLTLQASDTDPVQNLTNIEVQLLGSQNYVARIYTNSQEIAPGAVLTVLFSTYTPDNTLNSFYIASDSLDAAAYAPLSTVNTNLVNALTNLDLVLEIIWTSLTLFNPYGLLYMNAKFYRETVDLLKQVDVQYEPFLAQFLKANNNKVAGFKLPNLLSALFYGDSITSGWNRQEEVDLQYTTLSSSRVQDVQLQASDRLYEFEPYSLFIDNYGIQLTVLGFCLLIVGIVEIIRIIFKPSKNERQISNELSIFQAIRVTFRWNLCLATIIGSYQSLMYYALVQFKAFCESGNEKTRHNVAGFIIALFSFVILGICLPVYLFWMLRKITKLKKNRVLAHEHYKYEELAQYYGIFCKFYNIDRINYPIFFMIFLLRSFIFAILMLAASDSPSLQLGLMVGFSLAFVLYMLVLWPFKKFIHNFLQLLYEAVLFIMMSTLLLLSSVDNQDSNTLHREVVSYFILAIWCALPLLSTVSGIIGLVSIFFGSPNQKAQVVSVAPEPQKTPGDEDTKREFVVSAVTTSTAEKLNGQPNTQDIPVPSIEEVMSDDENPKVEDIETIETRPTLIVLKPRRYFF